MTNRIEKSFEKRTLEGRKTGLGESEIEENRNCHHLCPKMIPLGVLWSILDTIFARKWSPWGSSWRSWTPSLPEHSPLRGPLGDLRHHLCPKMVPLGVLWAILGTIFAENGPQKKNIGVKLPELRSLRPSNSRKAIKT